MMFENEKAFIEAILFLEGDPVDIHFIMKITDFPRELVVDCLAWLKEKYCSQDSGIELIQLGGGYILSPKQELWDHLKKRYGKKNDHRLSRAALETLSIIAYRQPVTRVEVENIRGVNADNMIRLLVSRDLIKEKGKKDVPGKPTLYGTTKEFLKLFRISSISDLPKLDEVNKERFELN